MTQPIVREQNVIKIFFPLLYCTRVCNICGTIKMTSCPTTPDVEQFQRRRKISRRTRWASRTHLLNRHGFFTSFWPLQIISYCTFWLMNFSCRLYVASSRNITSSIGPVKSAPVLNEGMYKPLSLLNIKRKQEHTAEEQRGGTSRAPSQGTCLLEWLLDEPAFTYTPAWNRSLLMYSENTMLTPYREVIATEENDIEMFLLTLQRWT